MADEATAHVSVTVEEGEPLAAHADAMAGLGAQLLTGLGVELASPAEMAIDIGTEGAPDKAVIRLEWKLAPEMTARPQGERHPGD